MRAFLPLLSIAVLFSACAKNPDRISAFEISSHGFKDYSCERLASEKQTSVHQLENLSAQQRAAADGDAIGMFLVGLPISSMAGNDREAAVSLAKGTIQAIERVQVAKGCIEKHQAPTMQSPPLTPAVKKDNLKKPTPKTTLVKEETSKVEAKKADAVKTQTPKAPVTKQNFGSENH